MQELLQKGGIVKEDLQLMLFGYTKDLPYYEGKKGKGREILSPGEKKTEDIDFFPKGGLKLKADNCL